MRFIKKQKLIIIPITVFVILGFLYKNKTNSEEIKLSNNEITILTDLNIIEESLQLTKEEEKNFRNGSVIARTRTFFLTEKDEEIMDYLVKLKNGEKLDDEQFEAILGLSQQKDKKIINIIEKFLLKTLEKNFNGEELKAKRKNLLEYLKKKK